jgi:fructokinase
VIKSHCQFNPLIKISEDDMLRLLRKNTHEDIFQFHDQGRNCMLDIGQRSEIISEKKSHTNASDKN